MRTDVIFVIDGSGSMANKAADVRGGFNTYVDELRNKAKEDGLSDEAYSLSAIVFNTSVFPLFTQQPLKKVPGLTERNYIPGGGTALYDAIGGALDEVRDTTPKFCVNCGKGVKKYKFCAECGTQVPAKEEVKYLVIIMTDGEENSSFKYRKHHIVQKIKEKEDQGNWTFIYLGANQDAMAEGMALGIPQYNSVTYNVAATPQVFANLAASSHTHTMSASSQSLGYFREYSGSHAHSWMVPEVSSPLTSATSTGAPLPQVTNTAPGVTKPKAIRKRRFDGTVR